MSPPLANAAPRIRVEHPADAVVVERLVLDAFGPGRFAKTAERLRETAGSPVGFIAESDAGPVGSVRLWPIRIGESPVLFLGPIAVSSAHRNDGLGAALVEACLAHAADTGLGVLLVGDAAYFERFGFERAQGVDLPGPVDRRRLLWRGPGLAAPAGAVTRDA